MLFSFRYIYEKERCVGIHKLLPWVGCVAALDLVVVEEQVRHLHEGLMHAILRVQEVERMACIDQSREERRRTIHLEFIRWSKLFLITNEYDLLSMNSAEEGFVLLDHRGFVHYDSFEFSIPKHVGARLSNRCDDDWLRL